MPLCTMHYFSESLRKMMSMNIILPDPELRPPYFTLYQLHGLSDDYSVWMRRTSIERYVAGLPLVVVMPDTDRGWYTNAVEGGAYESHIMKDTLGFVERFFPVRKTRAGRMIGGLSMGGYGAMKLGLKYPKVFGSVAAHSGAFFCGHEQLGDDKREFQRVFGKSPGGGPNDVFALAEQAGPSGAPAIYFDCGRQDFLIKANRTFHRHLGKAGIRHTYKEFPGIHEWDYWDEHFPGALKFHRKALGF